MKTNDVLKLFARFHAMYGHKWVNSHPDAETVRVAVSVWTEELTDFPVDWIARGLKAWRGDWPPSLPEFQRVCLPDVLELGWELEKKAKIEVAGDAYNFDNMPGHRSMPAYNQALAKIIAEAQQQILEDVPDYLEYESKQLERREYHARQLAQCLS